MWGQDLTEIEGFEELTVKNLKLIREAGALAAYASCL
jgi:tagaturonate reductase